jgi:hypothetical protein
VDRFNLEYTDTFAGETNYCWVRRYTLLVPSMEPDTVYTSAATVYRKSCAYERELVRKAKSLVGLTGIRCRKESIGETIALYPSGSCTVLFITPSEG